MTISTELRKLIKTMTGVDATGQTIDELLSELNDNYTGGGGGSTPIYWGTQGEGNLAFDITFQELKEKIDEVGTVMLGVRISGDTQIFQVPYIELRDDTYSSPIYGFTFIESTTTILYSTISGVASDTVSISMADVKSFVDAELNDTSTNPVENKAIKSYVDDNAKCTDVTTTVNESVLTLDMTHAELQAALDGGKTVRGITDIDIKVFSMAMGYDSINENSNVAYFLSFDGTNNTPMLMVSNNGALSDNITCNLS